jgi:hypothetical protein
MTQQPAMLGLSPQQLPLNQLPLTVDVNPLLEQAVLAIQCENMQDRSNVIYNNSKQKSIFKNIATAVAL